MRPVPGVKDTNQKSKVENGFGLKEVIPRAPRNNRMGQSHPICFSMRPTPGVRKSEIKSPNGIGLTEVGRKAPRNNITGQSPPIRL